MKHPKPRHLSFFFLADFAVSKVAICSCKTTLVLSFLIFVLSISYLAIYFLLVTVLLLTFWNSESLYKFKILKPYKINKCICHVRTVSYYFVKYLYTIKIFLIIKPLRGTFCPICYL